MTDTNTKKTGRPNQRSRTRKDLLQAAARLLKQGLRPSLEEVAEEALVSRATAYRYFPNIEALFVEALVDVAVPEARELFDGESPDDPVLRIARVDEALHKMIIENEVPLRTMMAHSLKQHARSHEDGELPVRQNRRTPLIEAALAPARDQFEPENLDLLSKVLALIVGTEAMLVFQDVLQLDDAEAKRVKRWAIEALVDAAKKHSK